MFELALATELVWDSKDALAEAARKYPDRFAGLGALAPQYPDAVAAEIGRMRSLDLCSAIVNSPTFGECLDHSHFALILEALEAEDLPLYLHPREPSTEMIRPYLDYGLYFPDSAFAAEAGLHAMRLISRELLRSIRSSRLCSAIWARACPFGCSGLTSDICCR